MKAVIAVICLTALLLFPAMVHAGLTQSELASVSFSPPANAAAPLQLEFRDLKDRRVTLQEVVDGHPSLLLFVDYTCRTICGPALAIATAALSESGLKPSIDYRLIVVGFDPKDTRRDALAMAQQIGDPLIETATTLLRGDAKTTHQLAEALGYRYRYDAADDQFAHPAGVLILTRTGRVSRILSSLALNPQDLRLALVEAGEGQIGNLGDRLTLLCYGFDAIHGIYTLAIVRALQLLALGTIASLLAFLLFLWRGRKQHVAGDAI